LIGISLEDVDHVYGVMVIKLLAFHTQIVDFIGRKWGKYFVGPIQFMVCYGAVVACTLLGGQCMKVRTMAATIFFFFHKIK
jgi:hypothetical protein